ncbi:MAG: small multi-drug export protein [Eubacteriaceae bacterium]|nr:small multi-drug export protein [Eubacteriaceae bacterium]
MLAWLTTTLYGKSLSVFLISMVPVIELRGAIPYGVAQGLPLWLVYILGVAGNMVPVPFIILFLRHIFAWLKKNPRTAPVVDRLERKAHINGEKVKKYRSLGLFILVAIPLPGTGAWTGSLVASVLDIRLRNAFPVILAGVATAGAIMMFVSYGVKALF